MQDKGATTQIKSLNKELKSLDTQYNTASKSGKGFDDSLSGLGTKLTLLNQKYEANEAKLKAYKSQLDKAKEGVGEKKEELEKLTKAEGDNTQAIAKTEKQLSTYQQQLHNAENSIKETEATMANLKEQIENTNNAIYNFNIKQFGKNLQAAGDKIIKIGEGVETTGETLMKLSAPFVALGGAAINSAIQFESSFQGVVKTVDASEEELAQLKESILDMSERMPQSASDIAAVAEAAGQLGIETPNIEKFTETMIMLGDATNLSSEEAATALAQLANITGMNQDNFDKLGSSIVSCGNNFATTESDIVSMASRLAGAGSQVGMSEADIIGLSAALSSVGITAEQGGSSFSTLLSNIQLSCESGGEELEQFASVSGMSAEEFKKAFEEDAAGALTSFITGLSKCEENGMSAIGVLDEMGISEVTLRDALLRASGASDVFSDAIKTSNDAWEENTALTKEAETRYETMESQIQMCKNKLENLGITIGEQLMPYVSEFIDGLSKLVEWFSNLDEGTQKFIITSGLMTFATGGVLKVVGSLTSSFGGVTKGLGNLITKFAPTITSMTKLGTTTTTLASGTSVATAGLGTLASAAVPLTLAITAAAAAVYGYHEYQDMCNKSCVTAREDLSFLEKAFADLTGTTFRSREELEEQGLVYKEFNENISPEFQEAVEDMRDDIADFNLTLSETSLDGTFTQEEVDGLKERVQTAVDGAISAINEKQEESQQALASFFNTDGVLSEKESEIMTWWSTRGDKEKAEAQTLQDEINAIEDAAFAANRPLTPEEEQAIMDRYERIKQLELLAQASNSDELTYAQVDFQNQVATLDAEGASELISQKIAQADELKLQKQNEFEMLKIQAMEGYDSMSEEDKAYADAMVAELDKGWQDYLVEDKAFRDNLFTQAYESNENLIGEINKYTGEMLSATEKAEGEKLELITQNYARMDEITESGLYKMQDKTTGAWQDMYVKVDEATGDIIGVMKTMTNEQGMRVEEIVAYDDEIKEDMRDTANDIVQQYNKMKNGTLDASGQIITANGEVVGSMEDIEEQADGTRTGIVKLNGQKVKITVDKNGTIADLQEIETSADSAARDRETKIYFKAYGLDAINYTYVNGVATPTYEDGGTVTSDTIAYTNETNAGFELIEGNATIISEDSYGSLTALSAGTTVYSNTASIEMMKEEIANQLSQIDFGDYYNRNMEKSKELAEDYNNLINVNVNTSNMENLLYSMVDLLGKLVNKDSNLYIDGKKIADATTERVIKNINKSTNNYRISKGGVRNV